MIQEAPRTEGLFAGRNDSTIDAVESLQRAESDAIDCSRKSAAEGAGDVGKGGEPSPKVSVTNFEFLKVLAKGGFGKVSGPHGEGVALVTAHDLLSFAECRSARCAQ